jgi:hypothetical protein
LPVLLSTVLLALFWILLSNFDFCTPIHHDFALTFFVQSSEFYDLCLLSGSQLLSVALVSTWIFGNDDLLISNDDLLAG